MPERAVQVVNSNGIHARPAAEIVKVAGELQPGGERADLKADGEDADGALEALAVLISSKFGES